MGVAHFLNRLLLRPPGCGGVGVDWVLVEVDVFPDVGLPRVLIGPCNDRADDIWREELNKCNWISVSYQFRSGSYCANTLAAVICSAISWYVYPDATLILTSRLKDSSYSRHNLHVSHTTSGCVSYVRIYGCQLRFTLRTAKSTWREKRLPVRVHAEGELAWWCIAEDTTCCLTLAVVYRHDFSPD